MNALKIKVFFVVMVLLASTMPALAQNQARNLAKAGVSLVKAGRYKEALKLLLQARNTGKVLGVNWNIGRCYEHMDRLEKALPYFQAFLRNVKGSVYETRARKKVLDIQERIAAKIVVRLRVIPVPKNASVMVDGMAVMSTVLRGTGLTLQPGPHTILVTRAGYRDRKITLNLEPGEHRTLNVALEKPAAWLEVTTDAGPVKECRVLVDSRPVYSGALPARIKLTPGTHQVRIQPPKGFEPLTRTVQLADKGTASLTVSRIPLPPPASKPVRAAPAPVVRHPKPAPEYHAPVITTQAPRPPRVYSRAKAGLFWGGIAALGIAGALNIWGYVGWKHTISGKPTMKQLDSARSSAQWKFYTAYALYGVGAACIITSFFVGHGRHPLGFAALPTPEGGGALVVTGTW